MAILAELQIGSHVTLRLRDIEENSTVSLLNACMFNLFDNATDTLFVGRSHFEKSEDQQAVS